MLLSIVMALRGYTMPRLMSSIRHRLRGNYIRARPWWYLKRYAPSGDRVGMVRRGVSYGDLTDE